MVKKENLDSLDLAKKEYFGAVLKAHNDAVKSLQMKNETKAMEALK